MLDIIRNENYKVDIFINNDIWMLRQNIGEWDIEFFRYMKNFVIRCQ